MARSNGTSRIVPLPHDLAGIPASTRPAVLVPLAQPAPWAPPPTLTPRQYRCLWLVGQPLGYDAIARAEGLTREEVRLAVYEARERLVEQHEPRSLLAGLLGPGVWLLALAALGAGVALLFALALVVSLEVGVELTETVTAALRGGR